jgi:hypothetical protein
MGEIYRRATKVYTWLGEADRQIDCIDAGLDDASFASVVAAELMQVAQIGAASPPFMCCPSLPTPRPMTTGKADTVRVNEVFS